MNNNPLVFISYSWDNETHKEWVLSLSNRLINDGVDIILDRFNLIPGSNLPFFVEDSICRSDKIILILTPNYKLKAENRNGGVGHEFSIINNELVKNIVDNKRIIPILKNGDEKESIPVFMQQYLYLDFRDNGIYNESYIELLRVIYQESKIKKPRLGEKPNFREITLREKISIRDFLMPIEDVFDIEGRGIVVTGKIESGIICTGDELEINGLDIEGKRVFCTGVVLSKKVVDKGEIGDDVGLLLKGINYIDEIKRGMVIAKPKIIASHTKFIANVYFLTENEGGLDSPIVKNIRPVFYIRTIDLVGEIQIPKDVEYIAPGDNVNLTIELLHPIALNKGLNFAIRYKNKTIGGGEILEILE